MGIVGADTVVLVSVGHSQYSSPTHVDVTVVPDVDVLDVDVLEVVVLEVVVLEVVVLEVVVEVVQHSPKSAQSPDASGAWPEPALKPNDK